MLKIAYLMGQKTAYQAYVAQLLSLLGRSAGAHLAAGGVR